MTLVLEPDELARPAAESRPESAPRARAAEATAPGSSSARLRVLLLAWLVAIFAGLGLVIYGLGPAFQVREQRSLMVRFTQDLEQASNEATGLGGVEAASRAPELGAPVAILEIGSIKLQQVVVEGVGSSQTRLGPGHVPGTAGLGQPGNAAVVGRHAGFGGPFGDLASVGAGDEIVVSTTQGQSVYEVSSVSRRDLQTEALDDSTAPPVPGGSEGGGPLLLDELYGPTEQDQLTLVTSASGRPDNTDRAVIVVAALKTEPFQPTPQGGRSASQSGLVGEHAARASVVLAVLAYGALLGGVVILYRRLPPRTAYLLTVAPVLAMTIVAGETLSRLLPAWT